MASYLWCHVAHGTAIGLQAADAFVGCEAEVGELQFHVLVYEDILQFDVPVNDSFLVHIFHGFNHLSQEKSAHVFAHSTIRLAQVKEKRAFDVLKC